MIVKPIASPAIDLNVPPGSAAVAKTTQTRKKRQHDLDHEPCQTVTPLPRLGAPRCVSRRTLAG